MAREAVGNRCSHTDMSYGHVLSRKLCLELSAWYESLSRLYLTKSRTISTPWIRVCETNHLIALRGAKWLCHQKIESSVRVEKNSW